MSTGGFGFNLSYLSGNEKTVESYNKLINQKIKSLKLDDNLREDGAFIIELEDGSKYDIFDSARSCCESRFMVCSDELAQFIGSIIQKIELREAPDSVGEYGDTKETQFCVIITDRGNITLENHNEHNGYYGGIFIRIEPHI